MALGANPGSPRLSPARVPSKSPGRRLKATSPRAGAPGTLPAAGPGSRDDRSPGRGPSPLQRAPSPLKRDATPYNRRRVDFNPQAEAFVPAAPVSPLGLPMNYTRMNSALGPPGADRQARSPSPLARGKHGGKGPPRYNDRRSSSPGGKRGPGRSASPRKGGGYKGKKR